MRSTAAAAASSGSPRRSKLAAGGLLLLALAVLAFWAWERGAERRAVLGLPPDERAALFERTRENVETLCRAEMRGGARSLCHDQARLLLVFPECDAAYRARMQEILEPASR